MNAKQVNDQMNERVGTFVENAWFKLLARGSIIIASLFVPFVTYQANQVLDDVRKNREATLELSYRVRSLENEVSASTDDRYRSQDAARDFKLRDLKDSEQDRRISDNERDINEIRLPRNP